MGDMLSQAEIDALLSGVDMGADEPDASAAPRREPLLTPEERDALGEIGNISMGTSATTLFALLGQKVNITTPVVTETSWEELVAMFQQPYVAVRVQYTEGLVGANLMVMKESDVKIITDLMMGGDGHGNEDGELNELHLSAISEAMNQMIGSSATSMSSMFDKRVDISPPESTQVNPDTDIERIRISDDDVIVKIAFSMTVGTLIDSEIMQLIPLPFAKDMVSNLMKPKSEAPIATSKATPPPEKPAPAAASEPASMQPMGGMPAGQQPGMMPPAGMPQQGGWPTEAQPGYPLQQGWPGYPPQQGGWPGYPPQQGWPQPPPGYGYAPPQGQAPQAPAAAPVNVQPAQFQPFDQGAEEFDRKNMSLLMDVPLQVTVELGRTTKRIREILEFGQGSILELDKLAGEPVDILVNGKAVAKGEVVVIDESFGVRITDILHPSKRL
jgi:flagellar motor switch protein FliN/FliY